MRSETALMLAIAMVALVTVATIVTYVKVVCSPGTPVLLETLPALREPDRSSGKLEVVSLDRANVSLPVRHVIAMRGASSLELRGWAVDPAARGPAAGVFAVVDDARAFRATNGRDARSFSVAVQSSEIGAGRHGIELRVVSADRSGYYRFAPVVYVVVR